MSEKTNKLNEILSKLTTLQQNQRLLSLEINKLKADIVEMSHSEKEADYTIKSDLKKEEISLEKVKIPISPQPISSQSKGVEHIAEKTTINKKESRFKGGLEKFIGENLINKIGIIVTIIGVSIGAKYAIDKELISPVTRIILGYLFGVGLLGFAIRLKKNYEKFSAVLIGGSFAIFYFITYAAFSFYALFSQNVAFGLMFIITIGSVYASLKYKMQVIAHIGLIGAYAIPFLLGGDPGNTVVLFTYISIINIGILVISLKKYWKELYYVSFLFTWCIFLYWFKESYEYGSGYLIPIGFSTVFFVIFYGVFLAYKLMKNEKFEMYDVLILLVNSFIFYGVGYQVISNLENGSNLIGLYTIGNAVIHFIVTMLIYKKDLADRNLFRFVQGLVILFITIAIPVQFKGNWITLLWVVEAALLFWIGRSKKVSIYEYLSYPLLFLAFLSLLIDWGIIYKKIYTFNEVVLLKPLLNVEFLSNLIFLAAFGFIIWLHQKTEFPPNLKNKLGINFISFGVPMLFLLVLYITFQIEIDTYWQQLYVNSKMEVSSNYAEKSVYVMNTDFLSFKTIWILNYTMLFSILLAGFNFFKLKNQYIGLLNLFSNLILIFLFSSIGLYVLGLLHDSYYLPDEIVKYQAGIYNVLIRYISIGFFAALLISTWKHVLTDFIKLDFKIPFQIISAICIGWVLSSELLNWLTSENSNKLVLSIFWGAYSLLLIIYGIRENKKHIRILAIVLFAMTLLKLFMYDISHLDTISKTIVFVSLGILLLVISFLYNKFQKKI